MLEMEHKKLNQRMATYTNNTMLRNGNQPIKVSLCVHVVSKPNDKLFSFFNFFFPFPAEIEANKAERTRLLQLHQTQQQERIQTQIMMPFWESAGLAEMVIPSIYRSGQEFNHQLCIHHVN